jgi:hypothetical protein
MLKTDEEIQVSLNSENNNWYCTSTPVYIYGMLLGSS